MTTHWKPWPRLTYALLWAALLAGCGSAKDPADEAPKPGNEPQATAAVEITPAARNKAKEIFSKRCTGCHGKAGGGDGSEGELLEVPPTNFRDADWQQRVSDEEIETVIVQGGAAAGLSPSMSSNPDLGSKPAVVSALREYIRGFGESDDSTSNDPKANDSKPNAAGP